MVTVLRKDFPYRSIINIEDKDFKFKNMDCIGMFNTSKPAKGAKWYAIKDAWADFAIKNYDFVGDQKSITLETNLYSLILKPHSVTSVKKPNKDKILSIKTLKDLLVFSERYGVYDHQYLRDWLIANIEDPSFIRQQLKESWYFVDDYRDILDIGPYIHNIDWNKVCSHFAGIEIVKIFTN